MATSTVAEYCRAVEAHLTRVNGGHLVRIVGPGFVLVRDWEAQGIPLSLVTRAIDQKADRHRQGVAGRSGRPLRIEFCENDVRELFEDWKRATGISTGTTADASSEATAGEPAEVAATTRRPSLSKHLERVSDRLSRLLGRQDLSESFLGQVNRTIASVADARDRARTARVVARDEIVAAIRPLDQDLLTAARLALSADQLNELQRQAEADLAAFRNRMDASAWGNAVTATLTRLIRERFSLPVIDPDEV